jgi:hypothetical protein
MLLILSIHGTVAILDTHGGEMMTLTNADVNKWFLLPEPDAPERMIHVRYAGTIGDGNDTRAFVRFVSEKAMFLVPLSLAEEQARPVRRVETTYSHYWVEENQ